MARGKPEKTTAAEPAQTVPFEPEEAPLVGTANATLTGHSTNARVAPLRIQDTYTLTMTSCPDQRRKLTATTLLQFIRDSKQRSKLIGKENTMNAKLNCKAVVSKKA